MTGSLLEFYTGQLYPQITQILFGDKYVECQVPYLE